MPMQVTQPVFCASMLNLTVNEDHSYDGSYHTKPSENTHNSLNNKREEKLLSKQDEDSLDLSLFKNVSRYAILFSLVTVLGLVLPPCALCLTHTYMPLSIFSIAYVNNKMAGFFSILLFLYWTFTV